MLCNLDASLMSEQVVQKDICFQGTQVTMSGLIQAPIKRTAAVPPTAGHLVTSERWVCGGPLAFHYANLMSHTVFRQSLAEVSTLSQAPIKSTDKRMAQPDNQYNHLAKLTINTFI
jgi:hypothetical protein